MHSILCLLTLWCCGKASSPPAHTPPADFRAERWYPRNLATVHPPWRDEHGRTLFPTPPPDESTQFLASPGHTTFAQPPAPLTTDFSQPGTSFGSSTNVNDHPSSTTPISTTSLLLPTSSNPHTEISTFGVPHSTEVFGSNQNSGPTVPVLGSSSEVPAFGGFSLSPTALAERNFDARSVDGKQHLSTASHNAGSADMMKFAEDRNNTTNDMKQSTLFVDDTAKSHRLFESSSSASSFHFSRRFHGSTFPTTTAQIFNMGTSNGRTVSIGRVGSTVFRGLEDPTSTTQSTADSRDFSTKFADFGTSVRTTRSVDEPSTDKDGITTPPATSSEIEVHNLEETFGTSETVPTSLLTPQPTPSEPPTLPSPSLASSTAELSEHSTTPKNTNTTLNIAQALEDELETVSDDQHLNQKRMSPDQQTTTLPLSPVTPLPEPEECRDILFVIDSSGAVRGVFEEQKQHVKELISAAILPIQRQAAVIIYGSKLRKRVAVQFSDSLGNAALDKKIEGLPFFGGVTATESALNLAASVLQQHPRPVDVVLFTDGFSLDSPVAAAHFIRSLSDHRIFVSGTYLPVVRKELDAIAGPTNVFLGTQGVERLKQFLTC